MASRVIAYPQFKDNEEYWNSLSFKVGSFCWVLIDIEDYPSIIEHWWTARYSRKTIPYIITRITISRKKKKEIIMHRLIISAPKNVLVDHKNRDTLDNRKQNLRLCTVSQNAMNAKKRIGTKGKYKGVYWLENRKKWRAFLYMNGLVIYLGNYISEVDAAIAYNDGARKYFGEFANPNIIE